MNTYYFAVKTRFLAAILAVVALFSLVSCAETPVLSPDGLGGYQDSKTDVSYRGAPSCYEAKAYVSDEIIAENDGIAFYALEGAPTTEWLWSPEFGMLLYSRKLTLPTLKELAPNVMNVYVEEDSRLRTVYEEMDVTKLSEILSVYEDGETVDYPGKKAQYTFYLKFGSEEYPWLLYSLLYVHYSQDIIVYGEDENGVEREINLGKDFIYNRAEDRCVAVGDEFQKYIDEYYHNTEADGEA